VQERSTGEESPYCQARVRLGYIDKKSTASEVLEVTARLLPTELVDREQVPARQNANLFRPCGRKRLNVFAGFAAKKEPLRGSDDFSANFAVNLLGRCLNSIENLIANSIDRQFRNLRSARRPADRRILD